MKYNSYILKVLMLLAGVGAFTSSCEDMLDADSKFVIYDEHLKTPADTANSLVGIIYKLQAIAERTHLLGEVRGDLVSVKSTADQDLLQMANFTMDDDNAYNNPRDYYAVINNCNYYIAYADTSARNSSSQRIFWREYVQVKAIRAWTYLQLALNYGSVQFYTDPILSEVDASKEYPRKTLQEICDYFIEELTSDPSYSTTEFPNLHKVGNLLMGNCFFPVDVVLGDLYLWRGSYTGSQDDYRKSAQHYCSWIFRNGGVGAYSKARYNITSGMFGWIYPGFNLHEMPSLVDVGYDGVWPNVYYGRRVFSWSRGGENGEAVTVIPMDSLAHQGYYNNMRYLYSNAEKISPSSYQIITNDDFYLIPSIALQELSRSQHYAYFYQEEGTSVVKPFEVPVSTQKQLNVGDMRLHDVWDSHTRDGGVLEGSTTIQCIDKPCTGRDIWIYRKTDLYLRLAEALNNGGFPHLAHMILAKGIDNTVIQDSIAIYWNNEQKAFYNNVLNADNDFNYYEARNGFKSVANENLYQSMGIHSRGCGFAELDPTYAYPAVPGEGNGEYIQMKADWENRLRTYIAFYWDSFDIDEADDNFGAAKDLQIMYGTKGGFKTAYRGVVNPVNEENVFNRLWNVGEKKVVTLDPPVNGQTSMTYSIPPHKQQLAVWWSKQPGNKEAEMRSVDQMILDEMALETCMEGKRFYDLMRHAIRYKDNKIVAEPVSRRAGKDSQDAALYSRLLNQQNWFMKWQDKMGF